MALKLSPWTYVIAGSSLSLAALSYGFFQHWKPNSLETEYQQQHANDLQTEADKKPMAIRKLNDSVKLVEAAGEEWTGIVSRKTPPPSLAEGGIDLTVNRYQLVVDARKYRNNLQRAVNQQVLKGGVVVINGPEVPAFSGSATDVIESGFNFPAIPFPVAIYDFGTITVRGTFEQICRNVEAWSEMPNYLAVADGLRFTGTSPRLTGTYNLSLVAYIRGAEIAPPVPDGAPTQTPGGGRQGGGGRGGGRGGLL